MKLFLKVLGWVALVAVALALISSLIVLIVAQFHTDGATATINLGDYEIAVRGLFDQPILTILAAWLITAGAFLIAGLILMLVFGALAIMFCGMAFVVASPLVLIALIVWYVLRRSRNGTPPSASLPPTAAA
jgi:hypothetical protein